MSLAQDQSTFVYVAAAWCPELVGDALRFDVSLPFDSCPFSSPETSMGGGGGPAGGAFTRGAGRMDEVSVTTFVSAEVVEVGGGTIGN